MNKNIYFLNLCLCGCNNIVYGNKLYIHNHHFKGKIGRIISEKTKKKISQTLMGNIPWNKGKINCVSEIGKENISKANKGHTPWNKGLVGVQARENHPNWKGGISFEPYCCKFNRILKEKIRNRDNRICQLCGKNELINGRKLTCHHIHYDKPNCDPDLISLCNSCNFKVNYNRDYWEQYFISKL